jgi:hypothetical protein
VKNNESRTETKSGTYQLATRDMELVREVTYFAAYEMGVDEFGCEWRGDYASPLEQATSDAQALADARGEPIAIVDPNCDFEPIVDIVEPRERTTNGATS